MSATHFPLWSSAGCTHISTASYPSVTLALGADQQAGDVVAATGAIGGGYQACAEFIEREIGGEHGLNQRVGEFAGQAIGAEQKEVAGLGL